MTIRAIDHVNIRAPAADIAKLKQFYCDVIGLSDGWRPEFQSRGHWLYAGTDPLVHLVEGDSVQERANAAGVDHVSFRSDDLDAFIERLRLRGIEFQLSRVPTLGHRQLLTRDPLGIGVEITAAGAGTVVRWNAASPASRSTAHCAPRFAPLRMRVSSMSRSSKTTC